MVVLDKFTEKVFFEPFLVVIITTPFAASLPYKAAADGPLNTEIDSISSGLMFEIPSPVCPMPVNKSLGWVLVNEGMGIPSTTYNALLFPEIDFVPRITTLALPPTPEELALMVTPATLPTKLFTKLASFTLLTSSPLISCTL
ncbi:hypothetical protein D3C85_1194010 [compost metagenome]